jgi:hypothetical protein
MIPAMCPACRCIYQVVGPSRLSGCNAQHTYDLTHCGACETSSGRFLPMKDAPETLPSEFGFPSAVVPVFDGRYGDWAIADDAQISTCAQAGLRARLVHRLAEEMRVPLLVLARWIGLHDDETLNAPARKTLKPGVAERLLHVARYIGIIQLRAGRESGLATSEAAPWLGAWLQQPHPELGGAQPGDYLGRPQDPRVLAKLLERTPVGPER